MDETAIDYLLMDALGWTAVQARQLPHWLRVFCVELLLGGEQR